MLRRPRFRLKSLIALVTVSAVLIGCWAHEYRKLVTVAVVTKQIPVGAGPILNDNCRLKRMPKRLTPEGSVVDLNEVNGYLAAVPLYPNEVLINAKLIDPNTFVPAQTRSPPGRRIISIDAKVAKDIAPGDLVELWSWNGRLGFLVTPTVEVFALNNGESSKQKISLLCDPTSCEMIKYNTTKSDIELDVRLARNYAVVLSRHGQSLTLGYGMGYDADLPDHPPNQSP